MIYIYICHICGIYDIYVAYTWYISMCPYNIFPYCVYIYTVTPPPGPATGQNSLVKAIWHVASEMIILLRSKPSKSIGL